MSEIKVNPSQYYWTGIGPHRPYNVDLWCAHPCDGGDDCMSGASYVDRDRALADFNMVKESMERGDARCFGALLRNIEWLIADGHDLDLEFRNPNYNPEPDDLDDWNREIAMQAGMGMGVDAYNDYMGY